jgi:hypothetical protein
MIGGSRRGEKVNGMVEKEKEKRKRTENGGSSEVYLSYLLLSDGDPVGSIYLRESDRVYTPSQHSTIPTPGHYMDQFDARSEKTTQQPQSPSHMAQDTARKAAMQEPGHSTHGRAKGKEGRMSQGRTGDMARWIRDANVA